MSECKFYSALDFLIALNNLITKHKIEMNFLQGSSSLHAQYENEYLGMACDLVTAVGCKVGEGKLDWNPDPFLSIYSEFSNEFYRGLENGKYNIRYERVKRDNNGVIPTVTVYCPRGCNTSTALIINPVDECAACGQDMHPDSEDDYYAGLIAAGQCQ